jgi:hypothetical protein
MRTFATELVGLRPDVLFAGNKTKLVVLQRATRDIPIGFTLVADPIAGGFRRQSTAESKADSTPRVA